AVVHRLAARIEDFQGDVNGGLRGHVALAGQLAAEVFAGLEAPDGDGLPADVGKAQLQQRERLGEAGAVVENGVYHQGTPVGGMAAHHQVATADLGDVHAGGQRAAEGRADALEP